MYVRHEQAVVDEVLALAARGVPVLRIATQLGISRSTVRGWLAGGGTHAVRAAPCTSARCPVRDVVDRRAYSYLLGQYLGDGWIDLNGRRGVYRLVISCSAIYPDIVDEVQAAIEAVMPMNRVGRVARPGVTAVQAYSKHWRCLFPQATPGHKHARPIVLETWQAEIALVEHPEQFVRGLIHSDGWRGVNKVRGASGKHYEYSRYQFTNVSADIRALFTSALDRLGIEWRQMNAYNVAVSRRGSVAALDEFVGEKS
ncbi:MAG TPA: helix-turn-helix domain-containing protein [Ilumatobacter sp.]|nr:helix-turn-helix domain-containing protein [Ilumatobacter sp.]